MAIQHILKLLLLIHTATAAVQLPLMLNNKVCTVLVSSFDPIKIDLALPSVPGHIQGQSFRISLIQVLTREMSRQVSVGVNTTYRNSFQLPKNVMFQLCVSYESQRSFQNQKQVYIGYTANQDFQSLIGAVEIPPQLSNQKNLASLYKKAFKFSQTEKIIIQHQQKEREIEDKIVSTDLHKSNRVFTLALIEVLVIVLSGVYQIFALRKFLIDQNLY